MREGADHPGATRDRLNAGAALAVVPLERGVDRLGCRIGCERREKRHEGRRILHRLPAALTEVGRHGVGELVAARLAERTRADVAALLAELTAGSSVDGDEGIDALAAIIAGFVRRLAERGDDHRARFALLIDEADRDEVRAILGAATPASPDALAAATRAFGAYGLELEGSEAVQLMRFADALLFSLVTGGSGLDVEGMVRAQLRALR